MTPRRALGYFRALQATPLGSGRRGFLRRLLFVTDYRLCRAAAGHLSYRVTAWYFWSGTTLIPFA